MRFPGLSWFAEKKSTPDMSQVEAKGNILAKYDIQNESQDKLVRKKGMEYLHEVARDTHVSSQLRTRRQKLLARSWAIQPASSSKQDQAIARFVKFNLMDMDGAFEQDLNGILTGVGYGFSLTEKVWQQYESGPYRGMFGLKALRRKLPDLFSFEMDKYGVVKPDGVLLRPSMYSTSVTRLKKNINKQ